MRPTTPARTAIRALALLAGLGTAAWPSAAARAQAAPAEAIPVRAGQVVRGTAVDTLEMLGTLVAARDATISAGTSGNLTGVMVRSGQVVKAGDPLFQLDDRSARADLEVQLARLRVTENALRRGQDLARTGNMPAARLDEVNSDYATATAQANAARARLDLLTLRAPFDGQVGIVRHSPGTFVQLGEQLVRLTDNTRILADFKVPQSHLRSLQVGQRFTVSGDALGAGRSVEGRISVIELRADPNTRTVDVRGELQAGGEAMPSGVAVRVTLELARREGRPMLPLTALVPGMVNDTVWRIEGGRARLVQVSIGARQGGMAEVTSGLEVGDQVVTVGQFRLRDGTAVRVVPEGAPSAIPASAAAGR